MTTMASHFSDKRTSYSFQQDTDQTQTKPDRTELYQEYSVDNLLLLQFFVYLASYQSESLINTLERKVRFSQKAN